MKQKILDILGRAKRIESAMAARVEGTARRVSAPPAVRPPLEVAHAVVDAVAGEVQPVGRGARAFPFTHVHVTLLAPSARDKAHLLGVVEGPQPLGRRILDRLAAAGCDVSGVVIKLDYAASASPHWTAPEFHVDYARRAAAKEPETPPASRVDLVVIDGTAARTTYAFTSSPVTIGRGLEVRDSRQRLVRTNGVAFVEGGGAVNESVSRRHAHLALDAATGTWRLFDDGSAQGSVIVRQGKGLVVPRGSKGVKLQPGDEIVLGKARLRVKSLG